MGKKLLESSTEPSLAQGSTIQPFLNTINDLLTNQPTKIPLIRSRMFCSNSHKWSRKETEYFYQLLGRYGTDFSIMAANYQSMHVGSEKKLGKNRSKKELLNKYKKEEKYNWQRITNVFEAAWKGKTFGDDVPELSRETTHKIFKASLKNGFRKSHRLASDSLEEKLDNSFEKHYSTSVSEESSMSIEYGCSSNDRIFGNKLKGTKVFSVSH